MTRANYAQLEIARRKARAAYHRAILNDIAARIDASGPDIDPYPIAQGVWSWEETELEDMEQDLTGPFTEEFQDPEGQDLRGAVEWARDIWERKYSDLFPYETQADGEPPF